MDSYVEVAQCHREIMSSKKKIFLKTYCGENSTEIASLL